MIVRAGMGVKNIAAQYAYLHFNLIFIDLLTVHRLELL
jgi:hypothetical protein